MVQSCVIRNTKKNPNFDLNILFIDVVLNSSIGDIFVVLWGIFLSFAYQLRFFFFIHMN